jgi:iron complex transport system substrate-binding protein
MVKRRSTAVPLMLAFASMALCPTALLSGCGRQPSQTARVQPPDERVAVMLTDAQGVVVTVEGRPERIVSAAPTMTEILFALGVGERVVAVTDHCNYPPEASALDRIGGWWTPSTERVLAAQPDLVISSRGNPPDFINAVRSADIPVFTTDPQTLDDIFAAIRHIGVLIGESEAGEELVTQMKARLEAVAAQIEDVPAQARPTVFMVLQVVPLWTAGAGTFQDDAMRAAGGRNIAADVEGFGAHGIESLLAKDPDLLLLSTMDDDPERMKREVRATSGLRHLSAVKSGRMIVLEADPIMRPGPRTVEAVEAMAAAFYPERFGTPH